MAAFCALSIVLIAVVAVLVVAVVVLVCGQCSIVLVFQGVVE